MFRKTRIIDTIYNTSNNELVRTKTLVKGGIGLFGWRKGATFVSYLFFIFICRIQNVGIAFFINGVFLI